MARLRSRMSLSWRGGAEAEDSGILEPDDRRVDAPCQDNAPGRGDRILVSHRVDEQSFGGVAGQFPKRFCRPGDLRGEGCNKALFSTREDIDVMVGARFQAAVITEAGEMIQD